LSGGRVAPIPIAAPANVVIKFVAVVEETLSVAVGRDRPTADAGAERLRAEPQVMSGLVRRHPRVGRRGGDGELLLHHRVHISVDLREQAVEERGDDRVGHGADLP
jgi:hypothetical protein